MLLTNLLNELTNYISNLNGASYLLSTPFIKRVQTQLSLCLHALYFLKTSNAIRFYLEALFDVATT